MDSQWPAEALEYLRERDPVWVRGNADRMIIDWRDLRRYARRTISNLAASQRERYGIKMVRRLRALPLDYATLRAPTAYSTFTLNQSDDQLWTTGDTGYLNG